MTQSKGSDSPKPRVIEQNPEFNTRSGGNVGFKQISLGCPSVLTHGLPRLSRGLNKQVSLLHEQDVNGPSARGPAGIRSAKICTLDSRFGQPRLVP